MSTPIPQPPRLPFIGNVLSVDSEVPVESFQLLAKQYGEIYKLDFLGNIVVNCNSYALCNELSDEKRFLKTVAGGLGEVRNLLGDGLFTAYGDEPNWALAHRILMPAFGPNSIRSMLDPSMRDISDQLIGKWLRFGPQAVIDPAEDFTKLTLDTLALCAMNYRLNSFYLEGPAPFSEAMTEFLHESGYRSRRPYAVQSLMSSTNAKYDQDQKVMSDIANQIIAERRANPESVNGPKDLLHAMLYSKDPKTEQSLPDDNICRNLLSFMIAGHETTSGTLTFAIYLLLKHPDAMRKLREEIDRVTGGKPPQLENFSKLPYMNACLRETLRLHPAVPVRAVKSLNDTTIGNGKYAIKKGDVLRVQIAVMHRDPAVWGEDTDKFRPERHLDGKFEALPKNAWQPFGYGFRSCIGRPFAWQEMQLTLAAIFQKFDLSMVDPSYTLKLKQTLTIKPTDFRIRASPRDAAPILFSTPTAMTTLRPAKEGTSIKEHVPTKVPGLPLYVVYGSNTGTCESLAQRIGNEAPANGFSPSIGSLDSISGSEKMPKDGPLIIITSSFEGQPPDNGAQFMDWLEHLEGGDLSMVNYAVFGCGNPDWVQTYQRIPRLCDELLAKNGATRLRQLGEGNVADGAFFEAFDAFENALWLRLSEKYRTEKTNVRRAGIAVKVLDTGSGRASLLRQPDTALGRVNENRILTSPGAPVKRHIEISLPEGMSYNSGDYLAILPHNPARDVQRVLGHFKLSRDSQVILTANGLATTLPMDKPVSLSDVLSGYVELSQPATTRDLRYLQSLATSEETRSDIQALLENYTDEVQDKRLSVFNVITNYSDIKLSLHEFLFMLPPMKIRQYSISSSPLWDPTKVTLTVSVLEAPAKSGKNEAYLGVASNYLASLLPNNLVQVAVRASGAAFHPPDPSIPIVMFCAGSGLAPMRGFMQERAAQKSSGREAAPILCFFGCRSPQEDFLYSDTDIAIWIKMGVLDIRPAFSRSTKDSNGCKYVQERVWHDREDIFQFYQNGAKFFTCGRANIAKEVKACLLKLLISRGKEKGVVDEATASSAFDRISVGRFATDIFD